MVVLALQCLVESQHPPFLKMGQALCREGRLGLSDVSDLSVMELSAMSQLLASSDVIQELDLSYCRIGDDGVAALAPGMAASTSLRKLE